MLLATDLSADNWPEFRGPTGQGHAMAVDLPTQWNDATNVRFKQAVPGHGWSSPVVYDGQVFLTTAVSLSPEDDPAADQSLRVLRLDAADGHVHWQAEVYQLAASDISAHKKIRHASPTPLVDNGHVYVHFGPHGTAKLDLAGKIVWAKKPFSYDPVHGTGSSPMLADGKLIINCDGGDRAFVAALNPQDGTVVWTTPRPPAESRSFSFCTPLAITVAGRTQVVSPGSHVVCSYDPTTGDELWRVRYPN